MHIRSLRRTVFAGLLVLAIGPTTATASLSGARNPATSWAQGGLDAAIGTGLLTLVVGGLALALGPAYTERVIDKSLSEPGRSFLVGFVAFLAVIGFLFFGVITRVFIIVALPLWFGFFLLALFGTAIAYLAIGVALTDGWGSALLVGVLVAAAVSVIPVLGGLVGFVVGSIGVGAVINHARDGDGDGKSVLQGGTGATSGPNRDW